MYPYLESNNYNKCYQTGKSKTESIKILQQRLKETEDEIQKQEELKRQNERDLKELSDYQKEIDTYLGRKNDEI